VDVHGRIVEAFFLDGASRQTGRVYPSPTSFAVSMFARALTKAADSEVHVRVDAWALGSSFVSEEEVLRSWQRSRESSVDE
jgi:hypothetical protein